MKTQARAGAVALAAILSGAVCAIALPILHGQSQQDSSGQQQSQDPNKKKKPGQQSDNAKDSGQQQSSGQQQQNNPPPQQNNPPQGNQQSGDKPTPLFGGTIGLKSSRQSKDSATLGFNGVDPNGQVQKSMLTASTTAFDTARAQQVAQIKVAPADLVQFIQDGGLTPDAAPQKP